MFVYFVPGRQGMKEHYLQCWAFHLGHNNNLKISIFLDLLDLQILKSIFSVPVQIVFNSFRSSK